MNLNNFVVLPNKTARSFKLNARNPKDLRTEAATLAHEGMVMEKRLQQLKESMSKEKTERRSVGVFGWKSLQSTVPKTLVKETNKENKLQKLSAGKVKIRVLKDEKHKDPPEAPPPSRPPSSNSPTEKGRVTVKTTKVSTLNLIEKNKGGINQGGRNKVEMTGPSGSLLSGEYCEEESARSFQAALREWRGERRDEAAEHQTPDHERTVDQSATVSAMATQSERLSDKTSGGRGNDGGKWKTPFRVEFKQSSLSYMDKLCLKKHRRTPIEFHRTMLASESFLDSGTEDQQTTFIAAPEDDDVQRRLASLSDVSPGRSTVSSPESNIVMKQ